MGIFIHAEALLFCNHTPFPCQLFYLTAVLGLKGKVVEFDGDMI
jgi:hypothetical protein